MTWSPVASVVIVSTLLVTSVICVTDLELQDNVVPEDVLQDLTVRIKKSSGVEDTESKSDAHLTAVLTEDIKRKIEDLKELKNAYHKVETDFFGSENQNLKSSIEKNGSESTTPFQDGSEEPDDESVRIARQYYPTSYSSEQYQDKKNYDSKKGMYPDNSYSNRKYQSVSSQSYDSYKDRDAPYIATSQLNPSTRTLDCFSSGHHNIFDVKPEATIHLPQISIKPVELEHIVKPIEIEHIIKPLELEHPIKPIELEHPNKPVIQEQPVTPVHEVKPPSGHLVLPAALPLPTITVTEHKPYGAAMQTGQHDTKAPLFYEKKEIGTPGSFFSKEIIYGPSKFGEGTSYSPSTSYSYGDAYSQSGYSSYPAGYVYGGSPSYLYSGAGGGYSSQGYSSYPDAQTNYNYGAAYSPGYPDAQTNYNYGAAYSPGYPDAHANYNYGATYSPGYPFQQGQAYYSAGGNFRSNRDLPDQFQMYQEELDSLLSQFFRADAAGTNFPSSQNHSSVGQLEADIEFEQKKIEALQEELKTPHGSKDSPGVSQSFVDWLSGEIDSVYSRWIHLKDDIMKPKQESGSSATEDSTALNVKV